MSNDNLPPLQPPRGMRDFYPEDIVLRNWIFDAWRSAARRAGFAEYDAAVVENLELLKRKAGEEILDQIYFFQDKSGRDLALRAEMTPTLARMVAARQGQLRFPIKWTTIAQCFRYERSTRGRKREHYQWNLDIIGADSVAAEAEVLAVAVDALSQLGLTSEDYSIRFSSRALLSALLAQTGIPGNHHQAAFLALDKRGKIDDTTIAELLKKEGVDSTSAQAVFELLGIASLEAVAERVAADSPALRDVLRFLDYAEALGIADVLSFDLSVIRGLSYYTGIVFEGFDRRGELRAIFGGGRYDNLLSDVGGKPQTGVGLGFGDVVISELLADKDLRPPREQRLELRLGFMTEAEAAVTMALAKAFRGQGMCVDLALEPEKPKSFFARAAREGYAKAAYVGPDDVAAGVVQVKNLATREQRATSIDSILRR